MHLVFDFVFLVMVSAAVLISLESVSAACSRTCPNPPDTTPIAGGTVIAPSLRVSPAHEVINNTDVGFLVQVGSQVWIQADYNATRNYVYSVVAPCPIGYRIPTIAEYTTLLSYTTTVCASPNCFLASPYLNFKTGAKYVSSTKANNLTDGGLYDAYLFYSITVNNNGNTITTTSGTTQTYFDSFITKCIRDTTIPGIIQINGLPYPQQNLVVGASLSLSVANTNVLTHQWTLPDGSLSVSSPLSFTVATPTTSSSLSGDVDDCVALSIKLQTFDGATFSQCVTAYVNVQPQLMASPVTWSGNNVCTSPVTSTASLTYQPLSMPANAVLAAGNATLPSGPISTFLETGLHFSASTAPIAPIATGGAWVAFTSKSSPFNLYVIQVSSSLLISSSAYYHIGVGHPLHILARPWGFVLMYVDAVQTNKLTIVAYYTSGQIRWQQVIMNNLTPTSDATAVNPNQLFIGTTQFGMNFMFNPENGRLIYARGRIGAIFAHYNWFTGGAGGHTGDTFLTFDELTGANPTIVWSWGASHSLCQRILYDNGGVITTVALGDAYPMQLQVSVVNLEAMYPSPSSSSSSPSQSLSSSASSTVLDGSIPGNGGGSSLGRLSGGLMQVTETTFAAAYSRRVGTSAHLTTSATNTEDEFGIMFYNKSLVMTGKVVLGSGRTINNIKSAVYGGLILVGYTTVVDPLPSASSSSSDDFLPASISPLSDTMWVTVLNTAGTVIVPAFIVNNSVSSVSANDDWVVLNDGRVSWTSLSSAGALQLVLTPPPNGVHDPAARQTNLALSASTGAPTCGGLPTPFIPASGSGSGSGSGAGSGGSGSPSSASSHTVSIVTILTVLIAAIRSMSLFQMKA